MTGEFIGILSSLLPSVELFARAGGGGSSSGGGGGGVLIYFVSYAPMHFVGAWLRKKLFKSSAWLAAQIIGWVIAGIFAGLWLFLGSLGLLIAGCAIAGMGAGLYNWFSKLRQSKRVAENLKKAAQLDPTWNESAILARASEVFTRYQQDWSNRTWENFKSYMTTRYNQHSSLMIAALYQAGRINEVKNPVIDESMIVDLTDTENDDQDTVTVGITAHADDILKEESTGVVLFEDKRPFTEYWTFKRSGSTWLLDSIRQATQNRMAFDAEINAFAHDHGFYYSLDWGWLLIPKRGQLFGRAKFGTSDINNHVIGMYKNYLLQLYTYDPLPNNAGSYLIAQTNVPKQYGNIIVRRKKFSNLLKPIRGFNKISMEWVDFNKKYEVYATDEEQVTSFELLHPAFMEKLEGLPFEVNIEVVDNVVYLYAERKNEKNHISEYETMLDILGEAYKQMEL